MSSAEPGRVLRHALLAWGMGHRLLGRSTLAWGLLAAEILALLVLAWLTIGLIEGSAYPIPFLFGTAFLVAWAWQAIAAYRAAQARQPARPAAPERSPAVAIGWLSLPLLAWFTGFWLVAGTAATPAATLDRFVTAWAADELSAEHWPQTAVDAADAVEADLGPGASRLRDVRFRIEEPTDGTAVAIGEAVHYERRPSTVLWLFAGTELVPVTDERLIEIDLAAEADDLPGGGNLGGVRWEITDARAMTP